jgi:hypothetical protein
MEYYNKIYALTNKNNSSDLIKFKNRKYVIKLSKRLSLVENYISDTSTALFYTTNIIKQESKIDNINYNKL